MTPPILLIAGPPASGKTALALRAARTLGCGIVNAAALQLAAALPNVDLVEYIAGSAYVDNIMATPFKLDADGMLAIPDTPGLGVSLDVDRVARYSPVAKSLFA